MWTNEHEKLSFQFAKYGPFVNTNIFDVASSNVTTYLSWRQPPTLQKLQIFNAFKCLGPWISVSWATKLFSGDNLPRMRTIVSVFIFHFCENLFSSSFVSSIWTGRGLRDATDVLLPCKKQRVKPWRPMLYWTGAEEYVYPFNVNICCFELFTSGSMTARNILTWLPLIFEVNFVLLGQVLVGVHSWNRSTYLKERIFSVV